jgi:membrane protein DedA with SNARE-associated domain
MSAEAIVALVAAYGYLLLFTAILLDAAGLPLAGEAVLVLAGVLARSGGMDLGVVVLVGVAGAAAGHNVGYVLGRLAAQRWLTSRRLAPGALAILFSRFLVGVRFAIPPLSGHARTPYPRFAALDGVGAVLWVGALVLTGYAGAPGLSAWLGLA